MIKLALTVAMILLATSILAQDTQQEQCEAEGGCIIVTRAGLMAVLQAAAQTAYKRGLQACNSNI